MYDLLPVVEIQPPEIENIFKKSLPAHLNTVYKVVFKEEHMVECIHKTDRFDLQDYYKNPEKYKPCLDRYLPYLTVLVNGIYWDNRYPRFVTKQFLKKLYSAEKQPRLKVIGDISCDIEGSVECTLHATTPDEPVYVYDVFKDRALKGFAGCGPVIMAVDNLPCELPKESSTHFSNTLKKFIPYIVNADFSRKFEDCNLPPEVKNAVIVYHGKLTPTYQYINNFL
jgi:alpha-aminoadipic semialdehyde synthase